LPAGETRVALRDLDLPPGYYTERDAAGTYLMDPEGHRVMPLPRFVPFEDRGAELEGLDALCRALSVRLSEQTAECERLRKRVARLEERLKR
jgi:hypothetical protein